MAFANVVKKGLTASFADLYTSEEGVTTVLFNGFLANKGAVNDAYVTVKFTTADNVEILLLNNVPIPVGSTILLPKKVIPSGAKLSAKVDSNSANYVDVSLELLTA